ncbi:GNAT family N-acetyltransferase [Actinokineospora sp. PR83]|uniref:GNAT family N-acetyltransferase n=1 Tax=Actinokineospora sp. PR83 TaxID=2884908 RepID=UPI0027DEF0BF|nr:GNAT family N-acetyltransferase [Actinokineospora sp. PR83]MCG8916454.1 GNAT family N-acetyltransferase [Actinokineospora sp. PR83]
MGELEDVCARAWPAVVTRPLGRWLLRASGGYTGRANSALAVGSPGVPLPAALRAVVSFSAEHGIRPYVQAVVGDEVEAALPGLGWEVNLAHPKGAESAVLTSALGSGPRWAPAAGTGVEVVGSPPPGWFELAVGGEPSAAQRAVLTSGPRVGFASLREGGAVVGVARGCVVGDHLHIAVLEVRSGYRRRGCARRLLAGLDAWAAAHGARRRVLQVATHNEAALALYRGLGYAESHRYRYWVPA